MIRDGMMVGVAEVLCGCISARVKRRKARVTYSACTQSSSASSRCGDAIQHHCDVAASAACGAFQRVSAAIAQRRGRRCRRCAPRRYGHGSRLALPLGANSSKVLPRCVQHGCIGAGCKQQAHYRLVSLRRCFQKWCAPILETDVTCIQTRFAATLAARSKQQLADVNVAAECRPVQWPCA